MTALSYKKVREGEIRGWVMEEIMRLLPPSFLTDPVSAIRKMNGEVLRDSRLRWAAIFTLSDHQRLFLKRDKTKDWMESVKYLFLPSKARKEWSIAYQAQKRKLNIPRPIGWMERVRRGCVKESYYLSEAIGSGASLIENSGRLGDCFPLVELARAVKKIHDAGLFHRDLHAGNFLWDGHFLFLTDLHSAKILKTLSLSQRLWNISLLFQSLRSTLKEKDQSIFMEAYFGEEPLHLRKKEALLQKTHFYMDRIQERHWRSRTKRCLKESTEFSIENEKGSRYYHRRDVALDFIKTTIKEHLSCVEEKPSALAKHSQEVNVSILNDGTQRVCVKQFCYPTFWSGFKENFRRSKGLRAWVAGNGLRARGIPSLKCLAFVENRDWLRLKQSFLLMEAFGANQEMDRYISKGFSDFKEKRYFVNVFVRWLSNLHKGGLYHRDMKTCNISVSKSRETWDFYLLDLEDVRLDRRVSEKELFKNFLQLNTSTPKTVTTTDRFRFFGAYLRLNPIVKDRKSFLRRLIDESKRRELVYVASWGVVTEKL